MYISLICHHDSNCIRLFQIVKGFDNKSSYITKTAIKEKKVRAGIKYKQKVR